MCMRVASKVLLCLLYILPASAKAIDYETARLEKRLHPTKITDKITIDGRLDELVWTDAPRAAEFTQREPEEGEQASEQTEVRVLYDQENLYFGITAKDTEVVAPLLRNSKRTSVSITAIRFKSFS